MSLRVELVNTGDELLLGRCVNTHLAFLGDRLFAIGLRIWRQVSVPDGEEIRIALREAMRSCDVLIVTGGLGPTFDDITRDVVADLLGLDQHVDETVADDVRRKLAARGRVAGADSLRQALVPDGGMVIPNPHGTAPGIRLPAEGGRPEIFLLPGPPRELRPMVDAEVLPRLAARLGGSPPAIRHLKFFGVGESEVGAAVEADLRRIAGLEFGFQVEPGCVNLRLIGAAEHLDAAEALVRAALDEFIISNDGRSLGEVVVHALASRGERLATAESCTGGFIAHTLTNVPGASDVFSCGLVTYANEAKSALLGVDPDLIARQGAVSEPVAAAMATGCLERSGDDHAVAVTGIAGPGGGSEEKPVGTVFIGVVSRGEARPVVVRRCFPYDRESFKVMVCQTALDLVRRRLR